MLGGEIESYQTETIPIFLHQLSKLFPEQYSAFIKAFPDYELKAPDYRGKYAKLSTCNRELIYRDAHGNSFRFDGDELVCDKYRISGFMPFSSSGYAQMRIPVTDDMRVKLPTATKSRIKPFLCNHKPSVSGKVNQSEVAKMKTHTLKFKGYHGRPKRLLRSVI